MEKLNYVLKIEIATIHNKFEAKNAKEIKQ